MNLVSYQEEYSKSFSEKSEENDDTAGTGRSYECIFCKRGFTTAQALGGHMNIHRKDKVNKSKPSFPNKVDDSNYAELGFYSEVSNHPQRGNNYYANNYHQVYFPATRASNIENQQDWRQRNLSLYGNPFSVRDNAEDGLDLELRLGRHP